MGANESGVILQVRAVENRWQPGILEVAPKRPDGSMLLATLGCPLSRHCG